MATTIRRLLFIVGSRRPEFYESLRRTFRGDDTVQVVLDRRRGERRGARRHTGRPAPGGGGCPPGPRAGGGRAAAPAGARRGSSAWPSGASTSRSSGRFVRGGTP